MKEMKYYIYWNINKLLKIMAFGQKYIITYIFYI